MSGHDDELIFEAGDEEGNGAIGNPAGIVLNLDANNLEHGLRWFFAGRVEKLRQAALATAKEGVEIARQITKDEDLVFMGDYSDGFNAVPTPDGATVYNDCPYAHVIEYGRRPGMPGPPLEPIAEWATLKLGITDEHAHYLIRKKIHDEGTEPKHVLTRATEQMLEKYPAEVRKALGLR